MRTIAMPTPTYVLMADLSSLVIRPPYIRSQSTLLNQRLATSVTYFSQTDGGLIAVKSQCVDQPIGRLWQHPDRLRLVAMSRYVLDHHLEGEKKRLALMSQLLDPMHRRYIGSLGISREARVLEVGCGNGSMSAWMAEHVAPDGQIVALDLDLSLVDNARAPGIEFTSGRHRHWTCRSWSFRLRDCARRSSSR